MYNLICRWWIHFQKWLSRSASTPASRRHCVHRGSPVRWKYVIHHRQYQWLLSEQGIHIHVLYIGGSMWPKRHNSKFEILHKYTRIKDSNFWVEKKKKLIHTWIKLTVTVSVECVQLTSGAWSPFIFWWLFI